MSFQLSKPTIKVTKLKIHQYPVGGIGYPAATNALLEQGTEGVQ